MNIVSYQYAPYINAIDSQKKENISLLITSATEDDELTEVKVNKKNNFNPAINAYQAPISFITGENSLSLFKKLKSDTIESVYGNDKDLKKDETKDQSPSELDLFPSNFVRIPQQSSQSDETNEAQEDSNNNSKISKIRNFPKKLLSFINFGYQPLQNNTNKKITIKNGYILKEEDEIDEGPLEDENEKPESEALFDKNLPNVPVKRLTEGYKTEEEEQLCIPVDSPPAIFNGTIYSDVQSNMNGNIFQNQRYNTYLDIINAINKSNTANPMSRPLHIRHKHYINDHKNQLCHPCDITRYTFPKVLEAFDEKNNIIKEMAPMTERELQLWLTNATSEEIYKNMHKIISLPKKIVTSNAETMEVFQNSLNYPITYKNFNREPKAFPKLGVKYYDYNVSIFVEDGNLHCTVDNLKLSILEIFPFPLHIAIGASSSENILNVHVVVQNESKDYCIRTLRFTTASYLMAFTYSDILYENIYYGEQKYLHTNFVQIYYDKENEDLRRIVNRWFRVPFELAGCKYEIINDLSKVSIHTQVFILMTQKKDMFRFIKKINKWGDNVDLVHQNIYGHPLQVVMATLKERLCERWILNYTDWKKYIYRL